MQPIHTKNRRIGLLGGSFNPAHEGHLHLSLEALKRLGLDEVWWLVSPQNPLKNAADLAPYPKRLQAAMALAESHPKIHVSDIEARLATRFSVDTVTRLQQRFPGTPFVWLMGADNLAGLHRWRRWRHFFRLVPIAVFDRAPFSHSAQRAPAALAMKKFLLINSKILTDYPPPVWTFVAMRHHPASATDIRKRLEKRRK